MLSHFVFINAYNLTGMELRLILELELNYSCHIEWILLIVICFYYMDPRIRIIEHVY